MTVLRIFRRYWQSFVVVAVPLIFLPIPVIIQTKEARCAYVVLIMALYWMTEVVPLAVTAILPVVLFPLLGVMDTGELCKAYLKETSMMFIGGLIVAIAVEHCNLHKRMALKSLLLVGTSPNWLMLGFMLTTMFLSMWISNTATTAMMVPIVEAVLEELHKKNESISLHDTADLGIDGPQEDVDATERKSGPVVAYEKKDNYSMAVLNTPEENVREKGVSKRDLIEKDTEESLQNLELEQHHRCLKMMLMAVAYSANVGGTGTITGTTPNLALKGLIQEHFGPDTGLNFATWMAFCVPGMVVVVLIAWVWLQFLFLGFGRKDKKAKDNAASVRELIERKYNELGPISFHETSVLLLFIILVFLWLFRYPQFITGWSEYLTGAEVDDATAALGIVFLLFVLPSRLNFRGCTTKKVDFEPTPALIDWQTVQDKLPWGVVLLIGGGFAMADAVKYSGLSEWLGKQLVVLDALPPAAIVFVLCLATALFTEIASNTATANILLPVLSQLAVAIKVHPLYLMLPASVTCSYAFMLPVATPPNAIVFDAGKMKTMDMIKAGALMNLLAVIVVVIMINTYGVPLFDLNNFPDWAVTNSTNVTSAI